MNQRKHTFYLASSQDNVATALVALCCGDQVSVDSIGQVSIADDIPFGFKFALRQIGTGEPVSKYGESIGVASCPIRPGELVHVHNLESQRGRGDIVQ